MFEFLSRTRAWFPQSLPPGSTRALARVELVARSIESALHTAQAEQAVLTRQLEDLTLRAVVPLGNGTDEFLTRDDLDNRRLGELEREMFEAERDLKLLAHSIAHFEFLRTVLKARFADSKPPSDCH